MGDLDQLTDDDYQRAFRYACALGADRDLALDLVQTALVKGLTAAARNIDNPLAYLMTSVRNCFYTELRRNGRDHAAFDDLDGVIATDLKPLEDMVIERDALNQVWVKLSPPERELLHLWAVEGHTVEEISVQTGTPRGTLLARLHRLRKRLASFESLNVSGANQ
ncbi:MAG: sigma-70 family RNA polymerase sigma factor [Wenzhouxiangella sp.]|nr:MAG: sigma-70 family RNA polymerase sigma factor [Wenzhouxiangella sp.]